MSRSLQPPQLVTGGFLCCLLALGVTDRVQAAGFRIPEASIAGIGMVNALVANPGETGALAYNPAAMAFHSGTHAVVAVAAVDPGVSVRTATGVHDSTVDKPFYVPALYLMTQIGPQWSWGINISSPFGLETNWPDETFPAFGTGPIPDAIEPARSKLAMVNVNPNIAYKLNSATALAVGLDYYSIKQARLDSQDIKVSGNGDGTGWNAALLHRQGDWSFGLSYRSDVDTAISGTVAAGANSSSGQIEVGFPAMWQVGARYQANDRLALEFDIELVRWSSFNALMITHATPGVPSPIVNVNAWRDAMAYRFGGSYRLTTDRQLRFGYSYDETAQGDDHFNARIPDADRHLFGLGLAQRFGGWTLEAGYMYILLKDRNYDSAVPFGTYGADANGTNAYNGQYRGTVHILGLGVSAEF